MTPRQTIAHYRITSKLGEGGMGEVYRARDTKLERDVAIKVLPAAFAADAGRMTRFEREARVLASLNHPNIAQIYGVEEHALVMELVEGESPKGPMPFDEAWKIASQIADALEYAHERGVIHRDLKPANVKVTPNGVVKLLDFGLAKALSDPTPADNPADSPTLTMGGTAVGVILGTAAYMSPEQARGKAVDRRADIWSFGVVLYEVLTGKHLFSGELTSDILASVIAKEPTLEGLPADLRPIVEKCLRKDPRKRWQAIGDVRLAMEERSAAASTPSPATRAHLHLGIAAWAVIVTIVLGALAFVHFRERAPVGDVIRFQIAPPGTGRIADSSVVISPDGRQIAFVAPGPDGPAELWVRSLDSLTARTLATTDAESLREFWSPDSRWIAFAGDSKLKKVDIYGGPAQTLCSIRGQLVGGAWNRDGVIIFGTFAHGLMRIPETGGAPVAVTPDISHGELFHGLPAFLPDQRHFLYVRQTPLLDRNGIYLGSLDTKPEQQDSNRLVDGRWGPVYVPTSNSDIGYLLFTREDALIAQPLNARRGTLVGGPAVITEGLAGQSLASGFPFSASMTGVLTYQTRAASAARGRLTWFNREGRIVGTVGDPGQYNTVSLSPDGRRAVVDRSEENNRNNKLDLWVHEFESGTSTRLTFDSAVDWLGVWSPDGNRIIFSSGRDGGLNLYQKNSSGAGKEEALFRSDDPKFAQDWSHDGRFLLYSGRTPLQGGSIMNLWILPLEGERKPHPYITSTFYESQGRFSPDDKFIAFASNESGAYEVYVRPFPDASAGQWQVSKGGGIEPRWRRDGKELFYISPDSNMMAAEISTTPTFQVSNRKVLFSAPILGGGSITNVTRYDVTPDGKKFLINSAPSETISTAPTPITVVLNWPQLLTKK